MNTTPSYDIWYLSFNFVVYCSVLAIVVEAVVRMAPVFFKETVLGVRLIHGLPLVLGALCSFIPGVIPDVLPGPKFFYGIIAGAFSGQVYAWVQQQFNATEKVASKIAGKVIAAKINQGIAVAIKPEEPVVGEVKASNPEESIKTDPNTDDVPKSDVEPGLPTKEPLK